MRRTLEFTLSVSNCLGCSFCPQQKLSGAYHGSRVMTPAAFDFILSKIPKDVEIHFSGFSEPFLNLHACEMMYSASSEGREVHVYSTLMGMKPGCVDLLSVRKPNFFRVHVPDTKALVIPSAKWIAQHELFLKAKVPCTYMSMGEVPLELQLHLAIHGIPVELPDMLSRGGNLWTPRILNGRMKCSMDRWHSNVVLPDGSVVGCCMDYSLTAPLGNILTDTYQSIFDRAEQWRARTEQSVNGTMCAKCEWAAPA